MLVSMLGLGEIQGVVLREVTPSDSGTWLLSVVEARTLGSGELCWIILFMFFNNKM